VLDAPSPYYLIWHLSYRALDWFCSYGSISARGVLLLKVRLTSGRQTGLNSLQSGLVLSIGWRLPEPSSLADPQGPHQVVSISLIRCSQEGHHCEDRVSAVSSTRRCLLVSIAPRTTGGSGSPSFFHLNKIRGRNSTYCTYP